ncbi:energy transducer TonB [Pseudoxanthomonas sp. Root630]|uniref:energy transducer TonB n=1 Tax=Pseudoxanthomonas sp. Root630 TaxID=1736574 RepID=UPI000702BB27|nr:energy transducer TonB [Pseudoxanthomonas sp. Root630]KRA46214.1 hypothetical protein ASD72_03040 [Pseudoxanthomonas sp. Root630]
MRYALLSALLSVPAVAMAAPAEIPAEVLARQTCQEHVVEPAKATPADLPKVSGEYNAYVIVDYRLDGSGNAVDPRVVEARPRRGFDDYALRMLARTRFAPGVQAQCTDVRTISKLRRGGR